MMEAENRAFPKKYAASGALMKALNRSRGHEPPVARDL